MLLKIAYPDYYLNLTEIDRVYEDYVLYEEDFYGSKFGFEHMNNRHSLDQLGTAVNRTKYAWYLDLWGSLGIILAVS